MNEDFLHFVWKNKLFKDKNPVTTEGEELEIIKPGFHNKDAGPDFVDARIRIGDTLWAGNVEIHHKASDWNQHKHQEDEAYENVILHVVAEQDKAIQTYSGRNIPTFEMKFDRNHLDSYKNLIASKQFVYCEEKLDAIDPLFWHIWMNRVLVNRLERKSEKFQSILESTKNNWDEAFYIYLASSFGFKTNALPFEMLARSIPLKVFSKHKNSLLQIEAILMGQAGFLHHKGGDEYYKQLRNEYEFLRSKFQLNPIQGYLWKFLRLRPANFPTIRIAQFASLIHKSSKLLSRVLEADHIHDLERLFKLNTSPYWETHYTFNETSTKRAKRFGIQSVRNIIINTIVPVLFVYAQQKDEDKTREKAMQYLESIPPESNAIITRWKSLDIKVDNAFHSQALLELYNACCKPKKCLHCDIGRQIITRYG